MSELQHVAEVLQAGMVTSIIPAHSSFEVDAMVDGEKLYIEPQIDALEQRIAELEALLKAREAPIGDPEIVERVLCSMHSMSADQRLEVLRGFCKHCGDDDPRCQCWNDE